MIVAEETRELMSGIYIENPKKWICLWALISTKETTHIVQYKTRFTLHFPTTIPQIILLWFIVPFRRKNLRGQNYVPRIIASANGRQHQTSFTTAKYWMVLDSSSYDCSRDTLIVGLVAQPSAAEAPIFFLMGWHLRKQRRILIPNFSHACNSKRSKTDMSIMKGVTSRACCCSLSML